jgi:hypothetical protein
MEKRVEPRTAGGQRNVPGKKGERIQQELEISAAAQFLGRK